MQEPVLSFNLAGRYHDPLEPPVLDNLQEQLRSP